MRGWRISVAVVSVVTLLFAAPAPAGADVVHFTHDVTRADGVMTTCAAPPTTTCYGVLLQAWDARNTNWAEVNAWASLYRVEPTSPGFSLTWLGGTWANVGVTFEANDGLRSAHLTGTFNLPSLDGNGLTIDAAWTGVGAVAQSTERDTSSAPDYVLIGIMRSRQALLTGSVEGVGWQQATLGPAPAPRLSTQRTASVDG